MSSAISSTKYISLKHISIPSKPKKRKLSMSYAQIDWDKSAKFFQKIPVSGAEKRTYPSVKQLLHLLAKASAIGMTFAFPGAAPALGSLVLGGQRYDRWRTKQIVSQMAKQKLVKIKEGNDGKVTVIITKNGLARALTYQLECMSIKKPKKWDKKWRVIIFDIPEKYRRVRDVFRMRLQQLGLHKLQESVFVYPYPCFEEIEFLRELYGVAFTVRYLLVEEIEDDRQLKYHFKLT